MHAPVSDLKRHTARYRGELDEAIDRVLDSAWFALGAEVAKFEAAFAACCGRRYCVGVGNGFDALAPALRAFELGGGAPIADRPFNATHAFFAHHQSDDRIISVVLTD